MIKTIIIINDDFNLINLIFDSIFFLKIRLYNPIK